MVYRQYFIQYITKTYADKTVAVQQNESSVTMGVEKEQRQKNDTDDIFGEVQEQKNGCICCSIRSDFILAIEKLLERRTFTHIIVECSGIVNPGPLIEMLWVDDKIDSKVYFDGVLTFVDSKMLRYHLQIENDYRDIFITQLSYVLEVYIYIHIIYYI